ncbi:two-component system histidine kinase PnpS [Bacillus seohaeanensis]|uniref:histidine kinase n=1 Tax=Bacillus seohaeanensis TaxID=284580 RepID=A0ABW5RSM4_9BACI
MMRFRTKLLFALITLIIAVLIALGLLLGQIFKNYYLDTFNSRIEKEAQLLANEISENGDPKSYDEKMTQEISKILDVRITITNDKGDILQDTGIIKEVNNQKQEEIITDITENWDKKDKQTKLVMSGLEVKYYWYPLYNKRQQLDGLLILSTKVDALNKINHQIWIVLSVSLGLSLIVIILLGARITNRYTKPIESATNVAIELAKGNYKARTYEDRLDETTMLSTSINILARNLQEMVMSQEMQQDRLTTLIENMGSALLLIDHRGYIVVTNRAFNEFFNIKKVLPRKRYHEVIQHTEVNKLVEEIFMTEQRLRRQILLPHKIERRHYEVYGAPIIGHNDEWNGIVVVFHDITELKKLEQMRKDFVANVSHELKTPITSIKGFSETLLDGAMKEPQTLEAFLDIILKESDRLQSLIQDLLELSKIEKQGFTLSVHRTDMAKLISEVLPILEDRARLKAIKLSYTPASDSSAEIDPYRMKQVFINLISNAIAYTQKNGKINVHIKTDEKRVKVIVEDNGIGIEEDQIPRIFERFYRVDKARSRNSGGTGLGLAIVKHIVEAHYGKIEVKSKVNKGSTFIVTLYKRFPKNKEIEK